MPGVLIIEALAQVGAVAILSLEENKGKIAYFGGINKCRFTGKVVPGDKIRLEKTGEILTVDSFRRLVEDEFTIYVTKAVFKNTVLPHKVFFRIENSEPGLDLVYSGEEQNKLFRWIADIDEEYALLELLPTHVVYIRNSQTRQLLPFISEKGNYYVYSQQEGKIKEIM